MDSLIGIALLGIGIASLYNFWITARVHGVNLFLIILAFLFWPIGVLIGFYWGVRDYIRYKKS